MNNRATVVILCFVPGIDPALPFTKRLLSILFIMSWKKSSEKMTILTKYVSYNKSALINCHFAIYAVHLYAKYVTHWTKFIKQTISRIQHFFR